MELSDLKERLSTCTSREAVLSFAEEVLENLFIHTRRRAFLLEESPGLPANPVMKAFEEMQTSLHEAQVVDEATWRAYCPRADHGHVLIGPLVRGSNLLGVLAVTRIAEQGEFSQAELARMNQLSLFFSTHLSTLSEVLADKLSPREVEVAELVRQGRTNQDIAEALTLSVHTVKHHLKSIFSKLNLNSRTELATF
ncbi:MAG: response regulator transcription factor [Candidatus Eremiobacteraeota bacterium]|nr:response regulator transcription factor [Candidatus Eremiobacteraeota bacterium]